MRRFKRKSKRTTLENSTWIPYTLHAGVNITAANYGKLTLLAADKATIAVSIAPWADAETTAQAGETYPWLHTLMHSGSKRLMRFQGAIYFVLPKANHALDSAWTHHALLVHYQWRFKDITSELTANLPSVDDWWKPTVDGESWRAMSRRDLMSWGSFIIQPHFLPTTGRFSEFDVGGAITNPGTWASSGEANFHQRMQYAKIPFPRVPKGTGLALKQNRHLVCEIGYNRIDHFGDGAAADDTENPTLAYVGEAQTCWLLPHFRYLLSHGNG